MVTVVGRKNRLVAPCVITDLKKPQTKDDLLLKNSCRKDALAEVYHNIAPWSGEWVGGAGNFNCDGSGGQERVNPVCEELYQHK